MPFGRVEKPVSVYLRFPTSKSDYTPFSSPSNTAMYTKTQLFILSYLFASFGLALPVNPSADVESRFPVAEADTSKIEVTKPPLDILSRVIQPEDIGRPLSALLEARDVKKLYSRANDPYCGIYAPDEKTRKQEQKNVDKNLSPDGLSGKEYAKKKGISYDGDDSGKRLAAETANGGPLPENCGEGCLNSAFSKASKVCSTIDFNGVQLI